MIRVKRWLPLMLVFAGCATAGPEANRARFQQNVGQAAPNVAYELSMRILRQYGFVVDQEQPIPNILILTRWKDRAPFGDEEALGITHAQNRMQVTARPRSTTALGSIYTVDVAVENRVQLMGSQTWSDASATAQYEKWVNQILEDFRREINTAGIRR